MASRRVTQFVQGFFFNLAHALACEAIFVGYCLKCPTGAIETEIETDDVGFAVVQCVEQGIVKIAASGGAWSLSVIKLRTKK